MKDLTLISFAEQVASDSPVPGGGSMAAVCGAFSAALAEMVANLTKGKKKYIEAEPEMKEVCSKAMVLRKKLLDDIERDSFSYNKVMEAYKLPKETEDEKENRKQVIQESLKIAASVPYEIAETAFEILPLAESVVARGNANAVTDGLIAGMLARTAVLAALYNVKINLDSIKDENFRNDLWSKVKEIETKTIEYEKKILGLSQL